MLLPAEKEGLARALWVDVLPFGSLVLASKAPGPKLYPPPMPTAPLESPWDVGQEPQTAHDRAGHSPSPHPLPVSLAPGAGARALGASAST